LSKSSDLDVGSGQTTVTTAGTRARLATGQNTSVLSVTIKALSTNTGIVYVGDHTVSSSVGFELNARDTVTLETSDSDHAINLTNIYLDASVSGEGVSFIYLRR